MEDKHKVAIAGFVIPTDWDKHGTVVAVSVVTDSFEKYVVADTVKGAELFGCLRDEKVEVEGIVTGEDLMGNKIIEITKYEVIKQETF